MSVYIFQGICQHGIQNKLLNWQAPCIQTNVTAMHLYPERFCISNETKGNGYIDNNVEVFYSPMHINLGKASNTVSFVSTQWGEPTLLAEVEFYPIPCHNTMTAKCTSV